MSYPNQHIPRSQGAGQSLSSLTDLTIVSGSGSECRTMAPYRPYSAIIVERPHVFSVLRHLARRFWNHTCRETGERGQREVRLRSNGVHSWKCGPVTMSRNVMWCSPGCRLSRAMVTRNSIGIIQYRKTKVCMVIYNFCKLIGFS